jgi:predicted lipoprotein with Yx(FWY)xxD motif
MSAQQPKLVQHTDGTKEWRLNGKYHRTDGPAIERKDGSKEWYLNGNQVDQLVFWVTTKEREMA